MAEAIRLSLQENNNASPDEIGNAGASETPVGNGKEKKKVS